MIENTNTKQFYPGPILNNTLEITDFLFNDAEQIKIKHSKLDEEGILVDVDLNYPTDYEVTKVLPSDINAAEAALTASTGQITLKNVNVLAGEKLTVYRVSQIIQDKGYPRTGAFPAATHEGALDYLTMQNQEQKDEIDRALKVPVSTQNFEGSLPLPIPSRALKINNDGTGFEMSEFDPDLALVTTEEFKNQSQQAAAEALISQNVATEQANIATQQANIAAQQSELVASTANKALEDIDTLSEESIETISNLANEIKDNSEQIINRLGFNLGDIIQKDHILNFEESEGLALLGTYVYKNGVAGSRYGYPDFYDKYVGEYNNSSITKTYLKSNVTLVGSLTNNQGILSGFSTSNYARIPQTFTPASNPWEYCFEFTTGSDVTTTQIVTGDKNYYYSGSYAQRWGVFIEVREGEIQFICYKGTANSSANPAFIQITTNVATNTRYKVRGVFTGTAYEMYLSTNGGVEVLIDSIASTTLVTISGENPYIGADYSGHESKIYNPFIGTIDLKESYININGSRFWSGADTVDFYENANGHRFYPISQKSYFDELFETTGEAWFYGIDEENERIFLPRETDRYLVEKKEPTDSDPTWYNLYSDGWCEQGGVMPQSNDVNTITFIKPYTNSNYTLTIGYSSSADEVAYKRYMGYMTKTSTSFTAWSAHGQKDWQTEGYTDVQTDLPKYKYMVVGNVTTEKAQTAVTEITTSENDTLPLFYNFYSQEDMTTTGAYVNASLGSWLSGNVYSTAYNELVNKLGVDNVKANTDEYTDYDFVVNQDDMTFRLPLLNGERVLVEKKEPTELDPTWYNLYSDGWCEQGGQDVSDKVINLFKSYKDTSYNTVVTWRNNTAVTYPVTDTAKTASSFSTGSKSGNNGAMYWQTEGYTDVPTNTGVNLYYKVANAVTNLELLEAGEVLNTVNNLIPNNKNVWDGQWVVSKIELSNSTSASQTIDLSEYLPDDGYKYDVLFNIVGYCATEYYGCLGTDLIPISAGYLGCTLWTSTNSRHNANTFIMPVGSGRYATWASNGTWGTLMINVLGYRRIGSNS